MIDCSVSEKTLPEAMVSVKPTALTGLLNVAVTGVETATAVAPDAGVWLDTAGWTASVVNDQVKGAVVEVAVLERTSAQAATYRSLGQEEIGKAIG